MSKQPDYYPEASRISAVEDYLKFMYDLTNEQLYDRLHDLLSNDEKAEYYQNIVKNPNFDAKAQLENDPEYKKYAIQQAAQNESPGSTAVAGLSFAVGIMNALKPRYKPDTGTSSGGNVETPKEKCYSRC